MTLMTSTPEGTGMVREITDSGERERRHGHAGKAAVVDAGDAAVWRPDLPLLVPHGWLLLTVAAEPGGRP
ncbi:hypothetical protein [Nonomuraea insulae]|uniref:Uncharacterized protein n=1 Tax=Nonomuraea insulae TaxID=1616787 RepID=A0ABW1DBM1_9ACTN